MGNRKSTKRKRNVLTWFAVHTVFLSTWICLLDMTNFTFKCLDLRLHQYVRMEGGVSPLLPWLWISNTLTNSSHCFDSFRPIHDISLVTQYEVEFPAESRLRTVVGLHPQGSWIGLAMHAGQDRGTGVRRKFSKRSVHESLPICGYEAMCKYVYIRWGLCPNFYDRGWHCLSQREPQGLQKNQRASKLVI